MEIVNMKEYCSQVQVPVNVIASIMVPPSPPSPKTILYLSNLDDHVLLRITFDALLVYPDVSQKVQNPVTVIRDALSEALNYYYPLAGRVKRTQDGRKLEVECTGEGALFVEAATDNTLSELGIMEDLKPSFAPLLHHFAEVDEVPALIFQAGALLWVPVSAIVCVTGEGQRSFLMELQRLLEEKQSFPLNQYGREKFSNPTSLLLSVFPMTSSLKVDSS